MVYDWYEVDTESFEDSFKLFWKGTGNSKNKVLEVQNLLGLATEEPWCRLYFGYGIKLSDWEYYNRKSIDILESMDNLMPGILSQVMDGEKISECLLLDKGPNISPLGLDGHYNLLSVNLLGNDKEQIRDDAWKACFNSRFWYIKKNGFYVRCPKKDLKYYSRKERYVRVRGIDLDTWKDMMKNYLINKDNNLLCIENDIPKNKIIQ